ncbi:hypothetical protein FHX75_13512 [Micromonospora palomenae]|uniref:Uncharacterized protein n=1 Tax=Micromonospora palomenae TaxID=1461247 RepID=A0A561VPC4_9ACTN|nr:hypothetical protein [Micromonospora palomenae]TWG13468.1 hypothetical protein FHX75_13512 [Micromonospora palomenae]
MSKWREQAPGTAAEWRMPATRAEIVAELELCEVPATATPAEACCRLELSGTWVARGPMAAAQRYRRERVSVLSGHVDR